MSPLKHCFVAGCPQAKCPQLCTQPCFRPKGVINTWQLGRPRDTACQAGIDVYLCVCLVDSPSTHGTLDTGTAETRLHRADAVKSRSAQSAEPQALITHLPRIYASIASSTAVFLRNRCSSSVCRHTGHRPSSTRTRRIHSEQNVWLQPVITGAVIRSLQIWHRKASSSASRALSAC